MLDATTSTRKCTNFLKEIAYTVEVEEKPAEATTEVPKEEAKVEEKPSVAEDTVESVADGLMADVK